MISSIIAKVNAARKARMATKALSQALVDGNLEQIEQALADGANPDKASMEFEMPVTLPMAPRGRANKTFRPCKRRAGNAWKWTRAPKPCPEWTESATAYNAFMLS